jgi:hypothetical protein
MSSGSASHSNEHERAAVTQMLGVAAVLVTMFLIIAEAGSHYSMHGGCSFLLYNANNGPRQSCKVSSKQTSSFSADVYIRRELK